MLKIIQKRKKNMRSIKELIRRLFRATSYFKDSKIYFPIHVIFLGVLILVFKPGLSAGDQAVDVGAVAHKYENGHNDGTGGKPNRSCSKPNRPWQYSSGRQRTGGNSLGGQENDNENKQCHQAGQGGKDNKAAGTGCDAFAPVLEIHIKRIQVSEKSGQCNRCQERFINELISCSQHKRQEYGNGTFENITDEC